MGSSLLDDTPSFRTLDIPPPDPAPSVPEIRVRACGGGPLVSIAAKSRRIAKR